MYNPNGLACFRYFLVLGLNILLTSKWFNKYLKNIFTMKTMRTEQLKIQKML